LDKLPWNHGCRKHDKNQLEKFLLEEPPKQIDNGYCLKLFLKFIASSRLSFQQAGSEELWNLFYALMQLAQDNPKIPVRQLWRHIDRKKFPGLINENGEINRMNLLKQLNGKEVCLVVDRGKGFILLNISL
jgi:hypothetical protein